MAAKNTEVPLEKPVVDETQTAQRLDTIEGRVNALEGAKDDAGDREDAYSKKLSELSDNVDQVNSQLDNTGDDGFVTRSALSGLEARLKALEDAGSAGDEYAKLGDFEALRDEVTNLSHKTEALRTDAEKNRRDGPHRSIDTLPRTEDL